MGTEAEDLARRIEVLEKTAGAFPETDLESRDTLHLLAKQLRSQLREIETDEFVHKQFIEGRITLEQYHKHLDRKKGAISIRPGTRIETPITKLPHSRWQRFLDWIR